MAAMVTQIVVDVNDDVDKSEMWGAPMKWPVKVNVAGGRGSKA